MNITSSASAVMEQEFLPIRAKLLEVAAALDRIDRAGGQAEEPTRLEPIRQAILTLLDEQDDRAEQIQLIFSRPYDARWREEMSIPR